MRATLLSGILLAGAALTGGCASSPDSVTNRAQAPATDSNGPPSDRKKDARPDDKNDRAGDPGDKKDKKGPPKTLFEWAVGPEVEEKEDEGLEPLATDRPDFTEASSTVGLGRVQLEAGYTYYRDRSGGAQRIAQTYPEALLRIGLFADWFELRIGQQFVHTRTTVLGLSAEHISGLDDWYVGAKVALTEQKGYLPETAVIVQGTVPTGIPDLTANKGLPGLSFLYGWDVVPDRLTLAGSTVANAAVDDLRHSYVELAQSITVGYTLTRQLGAYTEWFAFFPTGQVDPGVASQHYFNGGFTYKVTPDFQLDIRAGWGLNRNADDFFAGTGFAYRY